MVPAGAMRQMQFLWPALLAGTLLAGCGEAPPAAPLALTEAEVRFAADQVRWRVAREDELTQPDGWTSLVGLHWLDLPAHYIGSGSTSGIRLGYGPARLGLLQRDGRQWTFIPERGAGVAQDGAPVNVAVAFNSDRQPNPTVLVFDQGKGRLQLVERGGRFALRVRHAEAHTRRGFSGLTLWEGGLDWRQNAMFVAHPAGRTVGVVDMLGMASALPNPGVLQFERDGKAFALEAIDNGDGTWLLIFADRTSGQGSYPAGRYLDIPAPVAGQTSLVIDFNRAYNPPCAFSAFATCPQPPAGNRLDLRIEAGEKTYKPSTAVWENP